MKENYSENTREGMEIPLKFCPSSKTVWNAHIEQIKADSHEIELSGADMMPVPWAQQQPDPKTLVLD